MTLRQVWVRMRAMPDGSPIHRAVAEADAKAQATKRTADLDDALNRYRRG